MRAWLRRVLCRFDVHRERDFNYFPTVAHWHPGRECRHCSARWQVVSWEWPSGYSLFGRPIWGRVR